MENNENKKHNSSMMWMMLPCLLILAFALFTGGGGPRSWPFLLVIGAMVVTHLWMMFRGHGSRSSDEGHATMADGKQISPEDNSVVTSAENKGHSDHSCCH